MQLLICVHAGQDGISQFNKCGGYVEPTSRFLRIHIVHVYTM